MSGDTHFRLFPSILRLLRLLPLPSNLRPSPSPPPTSFLSDVSPSESPFHPFSFIFFILSTTSLFFPFRPLFSFVLLINCGSHVYFYLSPGFTSVSALFHI